MNKIFSLIAWIWATEIPCHRKVALSSKTFFKCIERNFQYFWAPIFKNILSRKFGNFGWRFKYGGATEQNKIEKNLTHKEKIDSDWNISVEKVRHLKYSLFFFIIFRFIAIILWFRWFDSERKFYFFENFSWCFRLKKMKILAIFQGGRKFEDFKTFLNVVWTKIWNFDFFQGVLDENFWENFEVWEKFEVYPTDERYESA